MSKPQVDPITGQVIAPDPPLSIEEILLRLGLGAVFGLAVGAAYFLTQRRTRAEAGSFVSTLVLLSILLAMVSMVIGSDIARAFSLVGALAIVRFRTVVEDTRDTAFVIFAVITGMAAGAGAYLVAAFGIPIVAAMAWALRIWGGNGNGTTTASALQARCAARHRRGSRWPARRDPPQACGRIAAGLDRHGAPGCGNRPHIQLPTSGRGNAARTDRGRQPNRGGPGGRVG